MRENRTYGSEGGEGEPFPTPIEGCGRPPTMKAASPFVMGLSLSLAPIAISLAMTTKQSSDHHRLPVGARNSSQIQPVGVGLKPRSRQ